MPRANAQATASTAQAQQDTIMEAEGIDSYELPKAVLTRIVKSELPPNAKLQQATVMSIVRGATVFINYLAATAQDVAHSKSHKTIAASDILKAMEILELQEDVPTLLFHLEAYRQDLKKGPQAKRDDKGKGKAPPSAPGPSTATTSSAQQTQDDAWPPAQNEHMDYDPYDANGGAVESDVAAQREREQALYEYGGAVGPFDQQNDDDVIPDEEAVFDEEDELEDVDEGIYPDDQVVDDDIVSESTTWALDQKNPANSQ